MNIVAIIEMVLDWEINYETPKCCFFVNHDEVDAIKKLFSDTYDISHSPNEHDVLPGIMSQITLTKRTIKTLIPS
jgi:hypothetical protein